MTEQSQMAAGSSDGGTQPAPLPAEPPLQEPTVFAADRPELAVAAAFAAGLMSALILKRLAAR